MVLGLARPVANRCLQDYRTRKDIQEMARIGRLGRLGRPGRLSMNRAAETRLPLRTGQAIDTSNVSYLVRYIE